MRKSRPVLIAALAPCLAGRITTQAMPLAPNQVRIDTQASGWMFTGQTVPETMKAAANATLKAGYTHFRLANADTGVGEVNGTACSWGAYGGGCGDTHRQVTKAGVTVTMFHANEPGAKDAFVAEDVLKQYGQ
jgi:hypothetical protein